MKSALYNRFHPHSLLPLSGANTRYFDRYCFYSNLLINIQLNDLTPFDDINRIKVDKNVYVPPCGIFAVSQHSDAKKKPNNDCLE